MRLCTAASPVDMEALVARYADPEFWKRMLQDEVEDMFG